MLWLWRCPCNCDQNNLVQDFKDDWEEDRWPESPNDDLCNHDGVWEEIEDNFLII